MGRFQYHVKFESSLTHSKIFLEGGMLKTHMRGTLPYSKLIWDLIHSSHAWGCEIFMGDLAMVGGSKTILNLSQVYVYLKVSSRRRMLKTFIRGSYKGSTLTIENKCISVYDCYDIRECMNN